MPGRIRRAADSVNAAANDARYLMADLLDGAMLPIKPLKGASVFLANMFLSLIVILIALIRDPMSIVNRDRKKILDVLIKEFKWIDELDFIPFAPTVDLSYDNYPAVGKQYTLFGGPHDGKPWTCKKERQASVTFTDGSLYTWNGWQPIFVEPATSVDSTPE